MPWSKAVNLVVVQTVPNKIPTLWPRWQSQIQLGEIWTYLVCPCDHGLFSFFNLGKCVNVKCKLANINWLVSIDKCQLANPNR